MLYFSHCGSPVQGNLCSSLEERIKTLWVQWDKSLKKKLKCVKKIIQSIIETFFGTYFFFFVFLSQISFVSRFVWCAPCDDVKWVACMFCDLWISSKLLQLFMWGRCQFRIRNESDKTMSKPKSRHGENFSH